MLQVCFIVCCNCSSLLVLLLRDLRVLKDGLVDDLLLGKLVIREGTLLQTARVLRHDHELLELV